MKLVYELAERAIEGNFPRRVLDDLLAILQMCHPRLPRVPKTLFALYQNTIASQRSL